MQHMVKVMLCLATVAGLGFGAFGGTTVFVDCKSQATEGPYTSPENAATNITEAMTYVATLDAEAFPVEIRVAKGTYAETGFVLNKPIAVVGATGDPKDVEIVDNVSGKRAFELTHADAAVRNLTVSGRGLYAYSGEGGHVRMTVGLVENCVIRDACGSNKTGIYCYCNGGNVWMSGGRLVRCQILDGKPINADSGSSWGYGGGLYVSGGTVDSCLVKGNGMPGSRTYGSGVYVGGAATLVNCTIVGNTQGYSADACRGIMVGNAKAKIVNCLICENGDTAAREFGTANLGCFRFCASSVTNDQCVSWRLMTRADFAGYEAGDYRLSGTSALIDTGTTDPDEFYPAVVSPADLDGKARVSGEAIDPGCYEIDQSQLSCQGRLDVYGAFENSSVGLHAKAFGGEGTKTYRWDFGNGVTNVTSDADSSYAYPSSGLFTVRVAASDDGGTTWCAWYELPTKVVVTPQTMYVDPTSPSPTYPYRDKTTAAHTVRDALAALTNNVSDGYAYSEGAVIRICRGQIAERGIVLKYGITICGDTGDPADVEILDDVIGERAFVIDCPTARVRDLTVCGGGCRTFDNGECGHVYLHDGVVENCILRDGIAARMNGIYSTGYGGNVYMTGGRLVRCVVQGGKAMDKVGAKGYGDGVYATGGTIDTCLVKANGLAGSKTSGGGVYVAGAVTVANSTFVGNMPNAFAVASASAKVINCVFYGNGGTAAAEFGSSNLDRFRHCASTVTNASCASWRIIGANDFRDSVSGDYRPTLTGTLTDGGSATDDFYPAGATALDMDGRARISGPAIDLGCYEADQSALVCDGYPLGYAALEDGVLVFRASAKVYPMPAEMLYRWDFGNGVTNVSSSSECAYSYPEGGLYAVRVSASADGGATWCAWHEVAGRIVVAPSVMFVDVANEHPQFPYKTAATAANSIRDALNAMTNTASAGAACVDGVTIRIRPGTLAESGISVSCALSVVGDTGDSADVEIVDSVAGRRAFTLAHDGAVVADLTISGTGYNTASGEGGHVYLTKGTLRNCIVRDGIAARRAGIYTYGYGGNVYMTGGRLERCQIIGGKAISAKDNAKASYGGGIYATGGTIDSCLVTESGPAGSTTSGGGICVAGGVTVVNTTVAGNAPSGIAVSSSAARIVNCVFYGNGGTAAAEFGSSNLGCFRYCASSATNDQCATWRLVDVSGFMAASSGDYRLSSTSPLLDIGTVDDEFYPSEVSGADLDGFSRVFGPGIDLGCYEKDQSQFTCSGYPDRYAVFDDESVVFTAAAKVWPAPGRYLYRWDFGNGVTNVGPEASFAYDYPSCGLYAVRVSASADEGETWCDWFEVADKVLVAPRVAFVDTANARPAFPYSSRETAATNFNDVLACYTNSTSANQPCLGGVTIRVCRGRHAGLGVSLGQGITVRGDTGNPADVEIVDSVAGKRAFALNHDDAVVRDLTVSGAGLRAYSDDGGHVHLTKGLVENCVLRDGVASHVTGIYCTGRGGNVFMTGGRLSRCQVLSGKAVDAYAASAHSKGGGVYASGGTIENCLVSGCGAAGTYTAGSGIYAEGTATVLNCTVVGNVSSIEANASYGVQVAAKTVRVANTVVYGNGETPVQEIGLANLDCFSHCASSITNDQCATWHVIDARAFRHYDRRDEGIRHLRPKSYIDGVLGPLVGTGTTWDDYTGVYGGTSTRDLLGGPRLIGRRLDIGCMEGNPAGGALIVR